MLTFDVPNLDDLTTDPDELDAMADTLSRLAAYAWHKAEAMRARLAGNIEDATDAERKMTSNYRRLPEWAQW